MKQSMSKDDGPGYKDNMLIVFPKERELISSMPDQTYVPNTLIPINPSSLTAYLESELVTHELDNIIDHLWFAGLPQTVVPMKHLHHHRVLGKHIILTEKIQLHLTSRGHILYLKPIPHCLLQYDFFHQYVCQSHVFPYALGFLSSYTSIIKYESDFRLAKEHHLLPHDITWGRWLEFSDSIDHYLSNAASHRFRNRFDYGELRLKRLDLIMWFTRGRFLWGYQRFSTNISSYFSSFWATVVIGFASLSIALSAFQVVSSTPKIQAAAYGFSIFTLFFLLMILTLPFLWFIVLAFYNIRFAYKSKLS